MRILKVCSILRNLDILMIVAMEIYLSDPVEMVDYTEKWPRREELLSDAKRDLTSKCHIDLPLNPKSSLACSPQHRVLLAPPPPTW